MKFLRKARIILTFDKRSVLPMLCWLLVATAVRAQGIAIGILPNLNLSIAASDQWKVNTKFETRQIGVEDARENFALHFTHDRIDLASVLTRKIGSRNSLGFGYLLRIRGTSAAHRLIQQYAFGTGHGTVAIAHRISADQTFRRSSGPEFRLRYRITFEIPLNGEAVNPKEFYLKLNNEYLGIYARGNENLEIRTAATFGFSLTNRNKLEFGAEHRLREIFDPVSSHQIFLVFGGYMSI